MAIDRMHACAVSYLIPQTKEFSKEAVAELSWNLKHALDLGFRDFLVGMQHGDDMCIAIAVSKAVKLLRKDGYTVRLIVAFPWRSISEDWTETRKEKYKTITKNADEIYFISKEAGRAARWMVDNSIALISNGYKDESYSLAQETMEYEFSREDYWLNPNPGDHDPL